MCGIAVILPGSAIATTPFAIEQMAGALVHRGPDEQGVLRLPGCHLGHTRLSIIDPANGHQPMTDPSRRYTIVFNGEIYNHRELRKELERGGHRFTTNCDTEVLLQAYIALGESVVSRLNGQFAFAIWDSRDRTLFAARDRFGEKPLYWARGTAGEVILASEIKALLATDLLTPRVDRTSVDAYLGLFYVPPDRTIYENIFTLPPAHAAMWADDGPQAQWRYWTPPFGARENVNEHDAVEQIRKLLSQAVRRQMRADVPVGAFLSGGLDSSTIVALMTGETPAAVRTFSVGFGELIDELPYARDVAASCYTDHHEIQTHINVEEALERMMQVYDEPFADSSNIPTYLVCAHARQHVKVVLSGDGGDEIFGGYDWYTPLLAQTPDPSLQAARGFAAQARAETPEMNYSDIFHRHLQSSTSILQDRTALWAGDPPQSAGIVQTQYLPPAPVSAIDGAIHFDVGCYLSGDILAKVDRAAMAHGLETRAPFLDVDLAEFVLSLPWQLRFKNGRLKYLLRAACERLWPPSVRARSKQGFGAPVSAWLKKPELQSLWEKTIRPDGPLCALLPGVRDASHEGFRPQRIWTLLCLGRWLESRTACLASLS